jgi:tetratricopeptide (TPR) repeat protein
MSKPLAIVGIILCLILIAFSFPQIAGIFFLNLANISIARAVVLPTDAPARAAFLSEAEDDFARSQSFAASPRAALAAVRIALARNDLQQALEFLNSSGEKPGNDPVAQFTWGLAEWRANNPDQAFVHWSEGNALEYFRQQMYRAQSRHEWKDARDAARIAMGVSPSFADAYYVLGDALSQLDVNDADAMRNLDRALELAQDRELVAAVLSRNGEILSSQNKLRDAIDVFTQARRIAPIDARPRTGYALATLQLDPRTRDQSVSLLQEVVNDSPWYVAAYIALSNISESSGQATAAETWLKGGLRRNPNNPALLRALGQTYARQHRVDEARASLILAMRNEFHADLLQTIAKELAELPAQ